VSDLRVFTSKMDSELKKECQIYCIREEIDLIELIDKALRNEIGYFPEPEAEDKKIFENN